MIGSLDNKSLVWIPVKNNYFSICISYEITAMWSIINLLSFNTLIDDVYSHTPYFDVVVWSYFYIPEEVSKITTQSIISVAGAPDVILIEKAPKLFRVTWVQYNSSCGIRKFLIRDFAFTIEWICISSYGLNYDVHVVTCLHKSRRSC